MGILRKAENTMAYFKAGFLGFQGSGKTYTATLLAIGICEHISNKTLCFFDTETGSAFLLPKVRAAGIEAFEVKSRAFGDLIETIKECEQQNIAVLIIDSITHVWRDLCDGYDKKLKRNGKLQFQDWARIKGEWQQYTDLFVNSKVHIIVCGRAGFEYDYDFNADGTKDLVKTGTKMKVESEFGFEPSLVVEMERISHNKEETAQLKTRQAKQTFKPKVGSEWIHRAYVLKDRTDTLNGKMFDYPKFDDFEPHFNALNIGGDHLGVDTSRNSQDRFDDNGNGHRERWNERRKIAIEEIQNGMLKVWPGTTKEEKLSKIDFIDMVFGTRSWAAVERETVESLEPVAMALRHFEKLYTGKNEDMQSAWQASMLAIVPKQVVEGEDIPL